MVKILFLDFDGVLAIPWTVPPRLYPHTKELLESYHAQGYVLALASFNGGADEALKNHGVDHLFTAMRYGHTERPRNKHGWVYYGWTSETATKMGQITNMLENELATLNVEAWYFFDDSPHNLEPLQKRGHRAFYVEEETGLTRALLEKVLNEETNVQNKDQ
jgi:hypothetical protein